MKINNSFLRLLNEAKNNFKVKIKNLPKTRKALYIVGLMLTLVYSIHSSWFFSDSVCRHYSFIGAIQKAPASFYGVFTIYALVYNLFNYNAFKIKRDDGIKVEKSLIIIYKLIPIYIINLTLAVCYVFIPLINYMCFTDTSLFWLVTIFGIIFAMPLLPMALSAIFVFLPSFKNIKHTNVFNAILMILFGTASYLFGEAVLQKLSDNAYTISTAFTKYYFPAAFFESFVTSGTGAVLFTAINVSAFYLSVLALSKINKL